MLKHCSLKKNTPVPPKTHDQNYFLLMFQVHELSDAFAKTSCSCIEDWDFEQDERVKVSYSLRQRLKIIWMKLKMKMYELMY